VSKQKTLTADRAVSTFTRTQHAYSGKYFPRLLAALLAVLCLLAGIPGAGSGISVQAEESTDDWLKLVYLGDFDTMESVSGNNIVGMDVLTEDDVSFLRIYLSPGGGDPYIYMPIGLIEEGVKCSEFKYLALRVRTKNEGYASLYFGTSDEPGLNEEKNQRFATSFKGGYGWETAVVDFSTHVKWTGYVSTARFDPYGTVPEGMEYIDIAWFAFVKSAEDLEKLDSALKDFEKVMAVTRMPVYATPNRTRPGDPVTPSAASASQEPDNAGLNTAVLVISTTVLVALIFLAVIAIIAKKRKT